MNNQMKKLENLLDGTEILPDIQKMEKDLKQQFEDMIG